MEENLKYRLGKGIRLGFSTEKSARAANVFKERASV
jgi:hypothetical protein